MERKTVNLMPEKNPLKDKKKRGIVYNWKSLGNSGRYKWLTGWYSGIFLRLVSMDSVSYGVCELEMNCKGCWLGIMPSGRLDHLTWGRLTSSWMGTYLCILSFVLGSLSEVLIWTWVTAALLSLSLPWHQRIYIWKMLNFLTGLPPLLRPPRSQTGFYKEKRY